MEQVFQTPPFFSMQFSSTIPHSEDATAECRSDKKNWSGITNSYKTEIIPASSLGTRVAHTTIKKSFYRATQQANNPTVTINCVVKGGALSPGPPPSFLASVHHTSKQRATAGHTLSKGARIMKQQGPIPLSRERPR